MTTQKTKVWDLFIRIFHWSLVIAFIVGYLTEGENNLHFYAGWYISLLLILRIIWGFFGSKHAKFSDFVKSPTEIIGYVKSLIVNGRASKKYVGHNPLGGLMVMALLFSLSMSCVTGIMLYTSEGNSVLAFMGSAPLGEYSDDHQSNSKNLSKMSDEDHDDEEGDELWEELHEVFTYLSLLLVLLHIAGVIFSSRLHDENLVKSMITGEKK